MKKIYHLKTCDTCKKIIKQLNTDDFDIQEIKSTPITSKQLEELYNFTKSYEDLFNKRAKLYREKNLKSQNLSENDYKNYILSEYTFLKRPVAIVNNQIFIGNSKKNIENLITETKKATN